MSWKKYDFIRQWKRVSKVIYCIRQLFENTIDRKCLIESILTIEYCQSNHIFRSSDSIPLRIDPRVAFRSYT